MNSSIEDGKYDELPDGTFEYKGSEEQENIGEVIPVRLPTLSQRAGAGILSVRSTFCAVINKHYEVPTSSALSIRSVGQEIK